MEHIRLIDVDVDRIVALERLLIDIVLDGYDVLVTEDLLAVHIARKAADTVVHRDDIRIEASD